MRLDGGNSSVLGIKNYKPTFYKDKNKFIQDHKEHLRALIGLNIDEVWMVHEVSDGKLWADCPVNYCCCRNAFRVLFF
ncbi:hypothetical protein [Alkalihalobacillus deserti]|uniref:hypothetical protein n=1 Tax=Alkalihalobacillus deserti TaxID=2879466 RepID=UPI001D14E00F|nr:hypothetical protein [Alkalihalobacillus deserti]